MTARVGFALHRHRENDSEVDGAAIIIHRNHHALKIQIVIIMTEYVVAIICNYLQLFANVIVNSVATKSPLNQQCCGQ